MHARLGLFAFARRARLLGPFGSALRAAGLGSALVIAIPADFSRPAAKRPAAADDEGHRLRGAERQGHDGEPELHCLSNLSEARSIPTGPLLHQDPIGTIARVARVSCSRRRSPSCRSARTHISRSPCRTRTPQRTVWVGPRISSRTRRRRSNTRRRPASPCSPWPYRPSCRTRGPSPDRRRPKVPGRVPTIPARVRTPRQQGASPRRSISREPPFGLLSILREAGAPYSS